MLISDFIQDNYCIIQPLAKINFRTIISINGNVQASKYLLWLIDFHIKTCRQSLPLHAQGCQFTPILHDVFTTQYFSKH